MNFTGITIIFINRQSVCKFSLFKNVSDGTVSYKEITRSFFVQELSEQNKPEVDIVIMPNVPLFAVASLIKVANNETLEKFMDAMDELEEENPQEVFIQNTVHKMLWGYDNPLTSLGDSLGMGNAKPKEESSDGPDKFGLMMGKNDTPAKSVRINTGEDDPSKMGQVQANNNKLFYGAWDLECDKISGKQFNSITSNLTMDTELEFSYQEMCRSLKFVADEKVVIEGVDGIKFIIHPDLLNYEAPENKCFCTRPDGEECKGWGYFELESCVGGLPIVTSLPHFLDSNAGDYFTMVEGFAPDPDLHKTTMILEPTLGFPLLINVKVQINLKITKSSLTDSLMNMPIGEGEEMFLPLFWLDAGMNDPDEEYYNKIKSALEAPEKAAGLVLIIGSAFLLIQLVLFFGICACLVKSKVGTEEAK